MIKIIKGVYGYLTPKGRVKPKTPVDEPFTLTAEQEARLVGLGVAKYVNATEPAKEPEAVSEEPEKAMEDMTAKELRELGKEYGLTFKVGTTKAEMVGAIKAAQDGETEDAEGDGEAPPAFDPAEAVE